MSDATPVLVSVVSGLVGLVASYFGIQWKIKKDLEAQFDASLRELRLVAYKRLWSLLEPLAVFARQGLPRQNELKDLSSVLRGWYFEEGGLYLSESARDSYFRLQRALRALSSSDRWSIAGMETLDADTFEHLRRIGSRLRTMLTLDVGTRNPFTFDDKAQRDDAAGPPTDDVGDPDEGPILKAWGNQAPPAHG